MIKIANDDVPKPRRLNQVRQLYIYIGLISFLVFGASGLVGILVDLDHLSPVLQNGLALSRTNMGPREFHVPYLILFGIIWCCNLPHVYRLHALVLKDKYNKGDI